jgi:hypothetical protein
VQTQKSAVWLAGRGVARSCGFSWEVPPGLYEAFQSGKLTREAFDSRLRSGVAAAQAAYFAEARTRPTPVERLLEALERTGAPGWNHAFVTTNWSTVLDRAVAASGRSVWHLNGSVEDPQCELYTEIDGRADGGDSLYRNEGFRRLLEARVCVLAGLSLASRLDGALIERLGAKKKAVGAGAAWVVVNEDPADTRRTARLLRECVPGARVVEVPVRFEDWVEAGLPELRGLGVIA